MTDVIDVTETEAWARLIDHGEPPPLRTLFAEDADRAARFTFELADLRVDLSKQRITADVLADLLTVADEVGVADRRDAMFAGERINVTEDRAVLHIALRRPADTPVRTDGQDVGRLVHDVLARMGEFTDRVRSGAWTGATGEEITDIVNIGIGGSDLGPAMAARALAAYVHPRLRAHFVSNVDGADIAAALAACRAGYHPVRGVVQDVHHDRDDHECHNGADVADGGPR